jgi:hypothetical protein
MSRCWFILLVVCVMFADRVAGEQPLSLIDATKSQGGWKFGNGSEFPGARGSLELSSERFRDQPVLALHGDFSQGGNYVQAQLALPDTPIDEFSFWINTPAGADAITIRLIDASEQCHQLKLKINDKGGWQQIKLPVVEFFQNLGTAAALDVASQYEKWGGANDGRWHQPGRSAVILCSRNLGTDVQVLFSDVTLLPSRPTLPIAQTIPLDEWVQSGELDWEFNLGQEFPGAKGGLEIARDQPESGKNAMHLHADFTKGGAYVGIRRSFAPLAVESMQVIRMKMRSDTTTQFGLRLVDGTGQCHQQKSIAFAADGKWHDVEIVPTKIAGGEHWGGSNDGKWHDSVQLVELMLNDRSSAANKPDLFIADIRAEVLVKATAAPATYHDGFESAESFGENWQVTGDVQQVATSDNNSDGKTLQLQRTLESIQTSTEATGKSFAVTSGMWQVAYSWKSNLHSPDNSYHASVALEVFDAAGSKLETIPVDIGSGKKDWTAVSKTIQLPQGAAHARFVVQLNKTYGTFQIDELSAARLKLQPIEQRIQRILIASDALGNLFLPDDSVAFQVTVETTKPLSADELSLQYSVNDYWGAEQIPGDALTLSRKSTDNRKYAYTAEISLPNAELQVGKYYELHLAVPQSNGESVTEYSGFAVLPPAVTRNFAAEDVPFTIRNWDSRIPDYFRLADRLGLRMLGVWGGWSATEPYKPSCPGIEICQELKAKWITGTPASQIELKGFDEYSEAALRQGMKNFLESYADQGLAMIAMGNEPHGTGEKVLENVRAYRAIYETVKAFNPQIHVIGTSVEPNEEYFRAGYQKYLDSYDFHIYEDYANVRRTMREYRDLMKKYDAVKPIHSTELGLNSQGQTRLAVSREMIKKIVSFFAEGGATASWFTIQYPDPEGKARGQFGDSHCMFDCKYNLYNPRLDAITHYHLLNAMCVKTFVEEKQYANGVQAYLFRDSQNQCLQVLWSDGKREDVFLPISTMANLQLIRIDGSSQILHCANGGVTLTISDEPLLLVYESNDAALADALAAPAIAVENPIDPVASGATVSFVIEGKLAKSESLQIQSPPFWKTSQQQIAVQQVVVKVTAPLTTTAREAKVRLQTIANGQVTGEIEATVFVESSD